MNESLADVQADCVKEMRKWVEEEAEFEGRKDEDFLMLFLRSCEFDMELSKKTVRLYYQCRVKFPLWWAERDLQNPSLQRALRFNFATLMPDQSADQPIVVLARYSNMGTDSSVANDLIKASSVLMEVGMRRPNCQLNGAIVIIDLLNCPLWVYTRLLWLPYCKNLVNAFLWTLPVRIKTMIFLNCSSIATAALKACQLFFPQKLKNKVHCFGSEWPTLGQVVPVDLLPNEYGGLAGPMKTLEEVFYKEVMDFNDYLLEDSHYGFRIKST